MTACSTDLDNLDKTEAGLPQKDTFTNVYTCKELSMCQLS